MTLAKLLAAYEVNETNDAEITVEPNGVVLWDWREEATTIADLSIPEGQNVLIRAVVERAVWRLYEQKIRFHTIDELKAHMTEMLEPGKSE